MEKNVLTPHEECCWQPTWSAASLRDPSSEADREETGRGRATAGARFSDELHTGPWCCRSSPFWCLIQGPSPDLCRACRFSKCQGVRLTLCLARGRKGPVPLPERGCLQMAIPTPELPVGRTGAPLKTTSCSRFPPPVSSPSLLPVLISDPR